MGSVARCIPQRAYISMMELSDSLSLNTWMRMGVVIGLSEKLLSTAAPNSLYFQKFEEVDCHLSTIPGLQRPPEGGESLVSKILLRDGFVPFTPVLLTFRGFLFGPVLSAAMPTMISCTTCNWIARGAYKMPLLMSKAG